MRVFGGVKESVHANGVLIVCEGGSNVLPTLHTYNIITHHNNTNPMYILYQITSHTLNTPIQVSNKVYSSQTQTQLNSHKICFFTNTINPQFQLPVALSTSLLMRAVKLRVEKVNCVVIRCYGCCVVCRDCVCRSSGVAGWCVMV